MRSDLKIIKRRPLDRKRVKSGGQKHGKRGLNENNHGELHKQRLLNYKYKSC